MDQTTPQQDKKVVITDVDFNLLDDASKASLQKALDQDVMLEVIISRVPDKTTQLGKLSFSLQVYGGKTKDGVFTPDMNEKQEPVAWKFDSKNVDDLTLNTVLFEQINFMARVIKHYQYLKNGGTYEPTISSLAALQNKVSESKEETQNNTKDSTASSDKQVGSDNTDTKPASTPEPTKSK